MLRLPVKTLTATRMEKHGSMRTQQGEATFNKTPINKKGQIRGEPREG